MTYIFSSRYKFRWVSTVFAVALVALLPWNDGEMLTWIVLVVFFAAALYFWISSSVVVDRSGVTITRNLFNLRISNTVIPIFGVRVKLIENEIKEEGLWQLEANNKRSCLPDGIEAELKLFVDKLRVDGGAIEVIICWANGDGSASNESDRSSENSGQSSLGRVAHIPRPQSPGPR